MRKIIFAVAGISAIALMAASADAQTAGGVTIGGTATQSTNVAGSVNSTAGFLGKKIGRASCWERV